MLLRETGKIKECKIFRDQPLEKDGTQCQHLEKRRSQNIKEVSFLIQLSALP